MIVDGKSLVQVRHPEYSALQRFWEKWRLVYRGGDEFNERYIEKFSNLENPSDFSARKRISPSPSFAKIVVNEIKNAIFQRMAETTRRDGPRSYQQAVAGQGLGVDLHGTSMTTFIGKEVLPELLTMAKVGIFVDMPPVTGPTMRDKQGKSPYLYVYKAEEILSWSYRKDRVEEFSAVLLVDYIDSTNAGFGLPDGKWRRHRLCWLDENNQVWIRLFDADGNQIDPEGRPSDSDFKIDLPYIPFITLDLTDSLLSDVANHQIALANLESSDMAYTLKSNFPIFTEQVDDRDFSQYLKGPASEENEATPEGVAIDDPRAVKVGNSVGRRYRSGMERPGFIHPSPEPVEVSMKKQEQLKEDIRKLVNLSLSSIKPKMASAESKALDMQGLESGLSYIGLELERGERRIAKIWADYERENEPAKVTYPKKWSLESEEDKRKDAEQLEDLRDTVPSPTFQKLISGKIVNKLLGDEIPIETREQIQKEIQAAKTITSDPDIILKSVEAGIIDLELAAVILGYPADAPKKAAQDHAEKLARIAESQSLGPVERPGARGLKELSANPKQDAKDEKAESRDTTQDGDVNPNKVRGEGKE